MFVKFSVTRPEIISITDLSTKDSINATQYITEHIFREFKKNGVNYF